MAKGMHLVGCDLNGVNAFFVDASLTDGPVPAAVRGGRRIMSRYACRQCAANGHPPSDVARGLGGDR